MRGIGLDRLTPWVASLVVGSVALAQAPGGPGAGRPAAGQGAPRTAPGQPAVSPGAGPAPASGGVAGLNPPDPAAAARMQTLLAAWEQRSSGDQTLYAEFTRRDKSVAFPGEKVYQGMALLKRPNLACLEFKEQVEGQKDPVFTERIVCSGKEVYHFIGPQKQVFVYPLAEDQRRRALEEGPLPFIFNMRSEEANRRYVMDLAQEIPPADGKPGKYVIRIIPKLPIDREEFSQAQVLLTQDTFLPEALRIYSPNGKDTKTFVFKKVERNGTNAANNENNFRGEKMVDQFRALGYKVIVNPTENEGAEARPAAAAANAPAGRPAAGPAAQPALRPGANGRRN